MPRRPAEYTNGADVPRLVGGSQPRPGSHFGTHGHGAEYSVPCESAQVAEKLLFLLPESHIRVWRTRSLASKCDDLPSHASKRTGVDRSPHASMKQVNTHDRDPSDGDIVARVLDGDRDAYRVLVRRHQDTLFRYALRMARNADEAADMVQSSFIKAYTRLHRCRDPDHFGAWIYRIVVNRCRDEFRKRRREVPLDAGPKSIPIPAGGADPDRDLYRNELGRRLNEALDRLPAEQKAAFIMKHVDERSYDEMSEVLDASISALKMRVHRAREALRVDLGEVLQ